MGREDWGGQSEKDVGPYVAAEEVGRSRARERARDICKLQQCSHIARHESKSTRQPLVRCIDTTILHSFSFYAMAMQYISHNFRIRAIEYTNIHTVYCKQFRFKRIQNAFKGFGGLPETMNRTVGPVSVNTPNPNPKEGFSSVRFGFEPQFRTEPSHH